MTNIKNRDKLLEDISSGLFQLSTVFSSAELDRIRVSFYEGNIERARGDLPTALCWLANDVAWSNEGNWAHADKAVVRLT